MRTTVSLDPDVEALLKEEMRQRGISFREALNSAVRRSLVPRQRSVASFPTYKMGPMNVPGHKFLQLVGEFDDEHILASMAEAEESAPKKRRRRAPR